MLSHYKKLLLASLLLVVSPTFASPLYQIQGQKQVKIKTNEQSSEDYAIAAAGIAGATYRAPARKKTISLMKIKLSEAAKKQIRQKANYQYSQLINKNNAFSRPLPPVFVDYGVPSKINLTMGNVPVLDQGAHGSCVTFATTTAIDAAVYNSDYVSQTCNMSLGKHLSTQNSRHFDSWGDVLRTDLLSLLQKAIDSGEEEYPSGWDGSRNELVIAQIKKYGIVSKTFESRHGCGGLNEYPTNNPEETGSEMSAQEFLKVSENVMDNTTYNHFMLGEITGEPISHGDQGLYRLKLALKQGQHIIVGMFIDDIQENDSEIDKDHGRVGKYRVANDTWVLTKQIIDHVNDANAELDSGHTMVIYGYDDTKTIVDADNVSHKGVLFVRNSWGNDVGDNGDFYMSYDYFKVMVDEAAGLSRKK